MQLVEAGKIDLDAPVTRYPMPLLFVVTITAGPLAAIVRTFFALVA